MFIDLSQPLTRLELVQAYEQLAAYLDDRVNDLSVTPPPRPPTRDIAPLLPYLDTECERYWHAKSLLLAHQARYDAGDRAIRNNQFSAQQTVSHQRLLYLWTAATFKALDTLFEDASYACQTGLSGLALREYWRDA